MELIDMSMWQTRRGQLHATYKLVMLCIFHQPGLTQAQIADVLEVPASKIRNALKVIARYQVGVLIARPQHNRTRYYSLKDIPIWSPLNIPLAQKGKSPYGIVPGAEGVPENTPYLPNEGSEP